MSEEEKEIEIINKIRDSITDNENIYLLCDSLEDIIKNNKQSYDIQIVVNSLLTYIDKLQKENKELQKCLEAEEKYSKSLNEDIKSLLNIEPNTNFISKDKIRTKIKELAKGRNYIIVNAEVISIETLLDLLELLEE